MSILVIGAGAFGLASALELGRRGHRVRVLDPGPVPHPRAASTDLSKVIRMEYGADEFYTALMVEALEGWRAWNREWNQTLFHETGVLMIAREPLREGDFEFESLRVVSGRGFQPERLDAVQLERSFPAWSGGRFADGFYHAVGGYAESGAVIARLAAEVRRSGVELFEGACVEELMESGLRVTGVRCATGARFEADEVLLAAGAWTGRLHPALATEFSPVAQPVFMLRPPDPRPFTADGFPVFTADIKRTGWYGFPAMADGLVKLANHGPGRRLDPDAPRSVTDEEVARLRSFLEDYLPALAGAPVAASRVCLYCDTADGDFWLARDPERESLTVAAGGSGHGFKFTPVLGRLAADALEGRTNPVLDRFRWRTGESGRRAEAARFEG